MNKILFKTCVIVMGLSLAEVASAQLLIERSKVVETVSPGETLVGEIFLHNTSPDTAFNVKAYWEDFKYLPPFDGTKEFLPAGTLPNSVSKIANFSPPQFTLEPKTKQPINFSIQVPPDAKGGYYCVIFFERGDQQPTGQIGVNVVFRIGALFFIDVAGQKKNADIHDIVATDGGLSGKFSNLSNIIELPKGIHYILDTEGLVVDRGELNKIYLPPNEEAEFKVELPENLSAGDYTVVLTFDMGEGDSRVKEIDFHKSQSGEINITELRD